MGVNKNSLFIFLFTLRVVKGLTYGFGERPPPDDLAVVTEETEGDIGEGSASSLQLQTPKVPECHELVFARVKLIRFHHFNAYPPRVFILDKESNPVVKVEFYEKITELISYSVKFKFKYSCYDGDKPNKKPSNSQEKANNPQNNATKIIPESTKMSTDIVDATTEKLIIPPNPKLNDSIQSIFHEDKKKNDIDTSNIKSKLNGNIQSIFHEDNKKNEEYPSIFHEDKKKNVKNPLIFHEDRKKIK